MAPEATSFTAAYQSLEASYIGRNPKSHTIFKEATSSLPGGNTRSVLFYAPFPLSVTHAKGSRLYDADGHEYVDLLGEYSAGLYGHSEPVIINAIKQAVDKGLNFGSQHEDEVKLAAAIKQRYQSIDLLRFSNSGTEATLMALAAAKAFTGKQKILVFRNGYHGGAFSFKGGNSAAVNAPHEWLIARYNSTNSVRELLGVTGNGKDLAAIMLEPMVGSGGAIPADRDFLADLRAIANEHKAVLIYDEVMTSRMHGGGGIQSQLSPYNRPDLTTLGKWIGGGMSFGAFGGRAEIMAQFDPRRAGSLAHAGTFNNNVLTMAAGRAGLEQIFTPDRAQELHQRGELLRAKLREISAGTLMQWTGMGSIMNVTFTSTPAESIKCPEDFGNIDKALGDVLHLFLLERGYYMARRGFIALSLALSAEELEGFVRAVEEFVKENLPAIALN